MGGLEQAQQRMADAGVPQRAIDVFSDFYAQLEGGATGMIAEADVDPLDDISHASEIELDDDARNAAASVTAVIKLNGGLGTSMGLDRAKTLLQAHGDLTFLDVIVGQVQSLRESTGAPLPLLFMNSFRTRDDTLQALAPYDDLAVDGLPIDFLQNREPKLRADDLTPIDWPADPTLEWCPPGHGDLYTALDVSGILDSLIERGFRFATVSNADNLGAAPDAAMMAWFAASGAPYAAEVCRRTPADVKGGHLVVRKSDGRLVLRETAQIQADDAALADDPLRHRYFHTNNLWFDLQVLRTLLNERKGILGLPLIRNEKTVDPTDASSPRVIQIESAMGSAVEVFDGATAIEVDRSRFLPVKTTNDLLLLQSDVYDIGGDFRLRSSQEVPLVDLDPRFYARIADFDHRLPEPPSLVNARSLTVRGDWLLGQSEVERLRRRHPSGSRSSLSQSGISQRRQGPGRGGRLRLSPPRLCSPHQRATRGKYRRSVSTNCIGRIDGHGGVPIRAGGVGSLRRQGRHQFGVAGQVVRRVCQGSHCGRCGHGPRQGPAVY